MEVLAWRDAGLLPTLRRHPRDPLQLNTCMWRFAMQDAIFRRADDSGMYAKWKVGVQRQRGEASVTFCAPLLLQLHLNYWDDVLHTHTGVKE